MYNLFLIWDIDITPIDKNIGEIKSKLDFEVLKRLAFKNEEVYENLKNKIYCPTLTAEQKRYIDIYYLDITIENGYNIKTRFFEITNTMLLTSNIECNVLKTALQRDFLNRNDTVQKADNFYNFRLEKMIEKMEEREFYDLTPFSLLIKTRLFNYQINNINWMIQREINPLQTNFTDARLIYFPDGRIYNHNNSSFIRLSDIPLITVKGGIIADEVGKGKTVQMLSLCYLRDMPTLIIVPNHLKTHWQNEQKKHFNYEIGIEIVAFEEYTNQINGKRRIIVDEIHLLYSDDRYRDLYDCLCSTKIEFKWALSATPFGGRNSIHKILQYLTDRTFFMEQCERYLYYKDFYQSFFKRNVGKNIQDELILPPLRYHNHLLEFNEIENNIYLAEVSAKENANELSLREFCCDVFLKYCFDDEMNESTFIEIVINDFEEKWKVEQRKFDALSEKLEVIKNTIKANLERGLSIDELNQNKNHYENLLKEQGEKTKDRFRSLDLLRNIMKEHKECNICMDEIEGRYCITKECQHYFCESCYKQWITLNKICPKCRHPKIDYYVLGDKKEKNPYSTKFMKILDIISETPGQIIIFTQFSKIIEKMREILSIEKISSLEFSDENINSFKEGKAKVLILSSKNNASGLDLSFCSNIIIFEPIRDMNVKDTENQIIGRINRINQTRECNIHRLIVKNTIEEQIYKEIL